MPRALLRSARVVLLLSAVALGAACKGNDAKPDAAAPAASALAPVPAPAALLADVFLPAPEATWQKARLVAGGAAMFLPTSLGGLVTTVLGLPITVAQEIDGAVPVVGAIVDGPANAPPRTALGVHVKDGGRFIDQLTRGQDARFTSKPDAKAQMVLLEAKGAKGEAALGVIGNYLLVARTADDLRDIGPYVARTLPSKPAPKDDVTIDAPEAALSGPLRARAKAVWARLKPSAEAKPTLAGTLLSVDQAFDEVVAVLGDASSARVTLDFEQGKVAVRGRLAAKAAGGPAEKLASSLAAGDAKPLLSLPRDTLVALLVRESRDGRKEGAADRVDHIVKALGVELDGKDRDAIVSAAAALATARGDWLSAGFRFGGTGPAAFVRGAVADQAAFEGAAKDLLALSKRAPLAKALDEHALAVSAKKTKLEKLGDVERVRFEVAKKGDAKKLPPGAPSSVDLFYTVDKDVFFAATGLDAQGAYADVATAPEGHLDGNEAVRAAIEGLGDEVGFALYVEPLALEAAGTGKPGGGDPAPVVLAVGRSLAKGSAPAELWVRLDVANADVQALLAQAKL